MLSIPKWAQRGGMPQIMLLGLLLLLGYIVNIYVVAAIEEMLTPSQQPHSSQAMPDIIFAGVHHQEYDEDGKLLLIVNSQRLEYSRHGGHGVFTPIKIQIVDSDAHVTATSGTWHGNTRRFVLHGNVVATTPFGKSKATIQTETMAYAVTEKHIYFPETMKITTANASIKAEQGSYDVAKQQTSLLHVQMVAITP